MSDLRPEPTIPVRCRACELEAFVSLALARAWVARGNLCPSCAPPVFVNPPCAPDLQLRLS